MPEQNFTPGPWKIIGRGIFAVDPTSQQIASVYSAAGMPQAANLRLIVEAPNMFALFKAYLADHVLWNEGKSCDCSICQSMQQIVDRIEQRASEQP